MTRQQPPTGIQWKLTRARTQLLLDQPFFGTLCLRLKLVPGNVLTMATNGRLIIYNPAFVESLRPAKLEAVLAHEVGHCALGHHCRRGDRDLRLWNEAADLAINPILVANGFTLPAGALIDPAFENLSAEEIHARRLPKTGNVAPNQAPQPGDPGSGANGSQQAAPRAPADASNGQSPTADTSESNTEQASGAESLQPRPGGFGEVLDATDDQGNPASQAELSRQQHEWNIAAEQAIRAAQACGREPSKMERPLSESRRSKQDWRTLLRDFVAATTPSDYRWTPPNRRYYCLGSLLAFRSTEWHRHHGHRC
jgi:predicted metal-dependent peptidase